MAIAGLLQFWCWEALKCLKVSTSGIPFSPQFIQRCLFHNVLRNELTV